jgi:6-pyruvoyltetrahydropterin/6-carboxytetrahydropterin synthase
MDGQAAISVKHNFETAHRLPFLPGKCESIHGHTWWAEVRLMRIDLNEGLTEDGLSVSFGEAKKVVRGFIDEFLDHGTMLGKHDTLLEAFVNEGTKVFVFGEPEGLNNVIYWDKRPWPTVEAVAHMLADELQEVFDELGRSGEIDGLSGIWVDQVEVKEGPVNSALWVPNGLGERL